MIPERARRRLLQAHKVLIRKEQEITEILQLPAQPRLSLLDEATTAYVTGADREALGEPGAEVSERAARRGGAPRK